ncbi:MAG: nicotinate phosphoribosyltransferase [Leptospiraceae bacterium]|nr:nicotinate phosphoribosyltransferase [Leptospiraceae bacterium]
MKTNLILDTDSYKSSHFLQYPPGTNYMTSYVESRGGEYPGTIFFGLQYILKSVLSQKVTEEMVMEANEFFKNHGLPFPLDGWLYIAKEREGKLPIKIRAVNEGSYIPGKNVLMTVESTDSKVYWIVGWLETMLLRIWYPITVSTQSFYIKKLIYKYLEETADDPDSEILFKLHDFGSRGVSSREQAMIGGAAHLVNFLGSDTVIGIDMANRYYNILMAGFSIPAAEHSTITAWGKENEKLAYENMLSYFAKKDSLVAVVSDSYDIYNACEKIWGEELKQKVIDSGATVVIRPDSGVPWEIVPEVAEILANKFGTSTNSKGYRVFNNVRIIQGDGVDPESIEKILKKLKEKGFSASNIAFGMGGALLQKVNRDTLKFAFKCSGIEVDGVFRGVSKSPITDPGKNSKEGKLELVERNGEILTVPREKVEKTDKLLLKDVFENGKILVEDSFEEIRKRAKIK